MLQILKAPYTSLLVIIFTWKAEVPYAPVKSFGTTLKAQIQVHIPNKSELT